MFASVILALKSLLVDSTHRNALFAANQFILGRSHIITYRQKHLGSTPCQQTAQV